MRHIPYCTTHLLAGNFKSPQSYNCNKGQRLAKYLVRDFEILVTTFLNRLVDKMNLLKYSFSMKALLLQKL